MQKKFGNYVAVTSEPTDIYVRFSGKKFFNTEKQVVKFQDETLYVNTEELKALGIGFSTDPRPFEAEKLCEAMIANHMYLSCYSDTYRLAEKAYDNWVADGRKGDLMDYAKAAYKEVRGEEAAI